MFSLKHLTRTLSQTYEVASNPIHRHPHCKVHSSVIVRYAVQLKCARLPNALAVRYGWSVSNGRWVIVHKHRGPVSGRASSAESYCWLGSPAVRTAVKSRSWRSVAPESRVARPVTGPGPDWAGPVRTGSGYARLTKTDPKVSRRPTHRNYGHMFAEWSSAPISRLVYSTARFRL